MTLFEEISVPFCNPPGDALGYDAVEGRLYCGLDRLELHFKQRDRAFRKNPHLLAEFAYSEIESLELSTPWLRPAVLSLSVRSSEKLADFPGAGVGRVDLRLVRGAAAVARKALGIVDFRRTEEALEATESRLERPRGDAT